MNPVIKYETGFPGDLSILALFAREEYPSGEIADERFLKWEYLDNPSGKALVTVAKDQDNTLAAQYAVIPSQFIVAGKTVSGSLSLNTLTAGRFRGMGLFAKSAELNYNQCKKEGISFTIGIPNENSYPGFIRKLAFTHIGNLYFLVKPLRPVQIVKSFLQKGKEKKGEEIRLKAIHEIPGHKNISVFDPDGDGEAYNVFWNSWKDNHSIAVDRTMEYIAWRYFKNPLRKYEVYKLVIKGEIKAIAAFRTMNVFGMRTCVILDFLSLDDESGNELMKAVSGNVKGNGLDILVAVTASKKSGYSLLTSNGFMQVPGFLLPQQLPFIIRLHTPFEGSEMLFNPENWHFSFGDYDIF